MVKLYVFWGLLALVLLGVGVTLIRDRRRRMRDRAAVAAKAEAAKAEAEAAATASTGNNRAAASREAAFDPSATRIHLRPSPANAAPATPRNGDGPLPPRGTPRLVCVGGSLKGHSFPITGTGLRVGRDQQNDIVLPDHRVSHHHAWVGIMDHKVVLRDLESTNGTFLNAHIDSLVHEVALSPGDTIFFGAHGGDQFRFLVD